MEAVIDWLIGGLPPGLAFVIALGVFSTVGLWGAVLVATRLVRKDLMAALAAVGTSSQTAADSIRETIEAEGRRARENAHKHHDELLERLREQDNAHAKRDKNLSGKMIWIAARMNGGQMPPEDSAE